MYGGVLRRVAFSYLTWQVLLSRLICHRPMFRKACYWLSALHCVHLNFDMCVCHDQHIFWSALWTVSRTNGRLAPNGQNPFFFGFIPLFILINPLTSWFYGTHGQNPQNELHSFLDNILIFAILRFLHIWWTESWGTYHRKLHNFFGRWIR